MAEKVNHCTNVITTIKKMNALAAVKMMTTDSDDEDEDLSSKPGDTNTIMNLPVYAILHALYVKQIIPLYLNK